VYNASRICPPHDQSDFQVVRRAANPRGLGEKGFSAALQMIIREWQEFQLQDPAHMTAGGLPARADRPWSHRSAIAFLVNLGFDVSYIST
jgi:hypothetical protein